MAAKRKGCSVACSISGKVVGGTLTHGEAPGKSAGHHQWAGFPSIRTFGFFRTLIYSYLFVDLPSRSVISLFIQDRIHSGRGDFSRLFPWWRKTDSFSVTMLKLWYQLIKLWYQL